MTVDCTGVLSGSECSKQAHAVNTVVCEHLFRQGKLEIGETLVKVCMYVSFHVKKKTHTACSLW